MHFRLLRFSPTLYLFFSASELQFAWIIIIEMSDGNPFPIMVDDCDLFEQDLFPNEFEYFCKHTQAFKSMWLEKVENFFMLAYVG